MLYVAWILALYVSFLLFLESQRWWIKAILLTLVVAVGMFPAIYYTMVVE